MDMNLGSSSFVSFGRWNWPHDNSFTLPREHIDILNTSIGSVNIMLPWSPQKYVTCIHIDNITNNEILIKLAN